MKLLIKKYAQLDEAVQDKLNDYEMTIYVFTDCTGEDIREMFTRQNNGKPLNNTQNVQQSRVKK